MTSIQLDELDEQLVALLSRDARVSNRKVAAELGVTEGTVRGRIKRLQADRLIAFTAITSFDLAENSRLAFFNIEADVANVHAIAQEISELPHINAVMLMLGKFNILAMCLFQDIDLIVGIASDQILPIAGVNHVETSIAVRTIKYNNRMAKITAPQLLNGEEE
jgi:Lrp/AsnC family transcriptional regulator, regulator for asnA, asnC and gidA